MKKFFLVCVSLCFGTLTFAQEPIDFKINPEIGKPLRFDMLMKTDVDGSQSVIMDMNMKMEVLPVKKEDENFTMENVIKAVKVDLNAGMMTVSYDSETESDDETAKMLGAEFSKIIDQKITTTVSEKGKTEDIDVPGSFSAQGFDPSTFSNISPSFPEKAVKPGESWNSTTEMDEHPLISEMKMTSTYREENVDGYIIDVKGTIMDNSDNEIGTISGDYTLDKKTLFTKSSAIKTTIEAQGAKIVSDVEMNMEL